MSNNSDQLEKSSLASVAIVVAVLIALVWLALRPVRTPAPRTADAPPTAFAAARALPDFHFLAQAPRPIASDANARARQYLVARLRTLGLEIEVQTGSAQQNVFTSLGLNYKYDVTLGVANNVLARIKGAARDRERRPALLVVSHYDSLPDRLGAADASAAAAAMLETLRALRHGAPPENDVIFLFADGEKSGSLGMRAFAERHRWASKIGLVLRFDAAGNSGPLLLTGTRGGNGKLIEGWADAAPMPQGNSVLPVLARYTPHLGRTGPLERVGPAGMRFANIEGSAGHQGGLDQPERLAHATLQHTGDTMLALTRHFGNVPLASLHGTDIVHCDLPVIGQMHYGTDKVWAITRLVAFMLLVVCYAAAMRSGMALRMLGAGALTFFALASGMAILAVTMWQNIPSLHEGYQPMANGAGARDRYYLLAYITLGLALFIEVQRRVHKSIGLPATVLGPMLLLLLILVFVSAFAPGVSYLLAWPMMAALLAYGALGTTRVAAWPHWARVLVLLAGAAPAVILFVPVIDQLATLYTPQRSALLMLTLAALLGLTGALLATVRRRFVAPLLVATCVWSLMTASATPQYEGATARPNQMTYLKDVYSWKSWWVMPAAPLDDWSSAFFDRTYGLRPFREVAGMGWDDMWIAPAPKNKIAFPEVFALKDDEHNGLRSVAFTVRSKNKAPTIAVRVEDAVTLRARLNGKLLTDKRSKLWSMRLHGVGDRENLFELDLEPGTIARIYIQERIPGLPDEAGKQRPGHTPFTGTTIASDMLVFY